MYTELKIPFCKSEIITVLHERPVVGIFYDSQFFLQRGVYIVIRKGSKTTEMLPFHLANQVKVFSVFQFFILYTDQSDKNRKLTYFQLLHQMNAMYQCSFIYHPPSYWPPVV